RQSPPPTYGSSACARRLRRRPSRSIDVCPGRIRDSRTTATGTTTHVGRAFQARRSATLKGSPYIWRSESRQPPDTAESPFGAEQAEQRDEDDRHVPEIAFLDDGDAAA